MTRQPFTREPMCPKCRAVQSWGWAYYFGGANSSDALRLSCWRCGYSWEMDCADAKPPEPEKRCETCKHRRTYPDSILHPACYPMDGTVVCPEWEPKPPDTASGKELKACPWCKSEPFHGDTATDHGPPFWHYVGCIADDCPVQPKTRWFRTAEEAIAAWNRRNND